MYVCVCVCLRADAVVFHPRVRTSMIWSLVNVVLIQSSWCVSEKSVCLVLWSVSRSACIAHTLSLRCVYDRCAHFTIVRASQLSEGSPNTCVHPRCCMSAPSHWLFACLCHTTLPIIIHKRRQHHGRLLWDTHTHTHTLTHTQINKEYQASFTQKHTHSHTITKHRDIHTHTHNHKTETDTQSHTKQKDRHTHRHTHTITKHRRTQKTNTNHKDRPSYTNTHTVRQRQECLQMQALKLLNCLPDRAMSWCCEWARRATGWDSDFFPIICDIGERLEMEFELGSLQIWQFDAPTHCLQYPKTSSNEVDRWPLVWIGHGDFAICL